MAEKRISSSERFKQTMCEMIDQIDLNDLQKQFMKSRWLDQLSWLSGRAKYCQKWYYRLRLMTIIGGVVIPALVSLNINNSNTRNYLVWLTFGLSQVVAISAAVEEFFHYGERWNRYRKASETLKSEGWQFFQLSGNYKAKSHAEAYPRFAYRVESIIQADVEEYSAMLNQKQQEIKEKTAELTTTTAQISMATTAVAQLPLPKPEVKSSVDEPMEADRSQPTPTLPREPVEADLSSRQ